MQNTVDTPNLFETTTAAPPTWWIRTLRHPLHGGSGHCVWETNRHARLASSACKSSNRRRDAFTGTRDNRICVSQPPVNMGSVYSLSTAHCSTPHSCPVNSFTVSLAGAHNAEKLFLSVPSVKPSNTAMSMSFKHSHEHALQKTAMSMRFKHSHEPCMMQAACLSSGRYFRPVTR